MTGTDERTEANKAFVRRVGTHQGPFGDVPATGRPVEIVNFVVHRVRSGRIAETWTRWDNLAFLSQVGLFPPPGGGGPG